MTGSNEIVSFAELESFIDLPVRTYSSGMHMRLGFAIAVHVDADVLLLDEVFAVGDEAFQRKCIGKILDFKERGGTRLFRLALGVRGRASLRARDPAEKGEVEYDGAGLGGDQALPGASSRSRRIPRRSAPACASGGRARFA